MFEEREYFGENTEEAAVLMVVSGSNVCPVCTAYDRKLS